MTRWLRDFKFNLPLTKSGGMCEVLVIALSNKLLNMRGVSWTLNFGIPSIVDCWPKFDPFSSSSLPVTSWVVSSITWSKSNFYWTVGKMQPLKDSSICSDFATPIWAAHLGQTCQIPPELPGTSPFPKRGGQVHQSDVQTRDLVLRWVP